MPPFSRQLNILQDKEFVSANNVFRGNLKRNKREGCDTTKEYPVISDGDLEQLYTPVEFLIQKPQMVCRNLCGFQLSSSSVGGAAKASEAWKTRIVLKTFVNNKNWLQTYEGS